MKPIYQELCRIAAITAVCGVNFSHASEGMLEEVRVTGTFLQSSVANALKSPTPILDVPQSLSIFDMQDIRERGLDSVADIVEYVPGLTVSQGEGHRDAVVFRGVRSTADFFLDGVRDDVQYYRPLYNIEQLEVLRGPNALLFGRGGTGGIINRVTKKPITDQLLTEISGFGETMGSKGLAIDLNRPLSTDGAARLNVMWEELDNHRDHFAGERIGFNPTVRLALSHDSVLDLYYEYLDHERFIDRGIPTGSDGRPVHAFQNITFGDTKRNNSWLEANKAAATLEHRFTAHAKGKISLFHGVYDKEYENLYVASFDQANDAGAVILDGYIDTVARESTQLSGSFVFEGDWSGFDHRILAGFEWIDTASNQNRWNSFWSTTSSDKERVTITRPLGIVRGAGVKAEGQLTTYNYTTDLNDDTRVDLNVQSLYVQNEISLTEHFEAVIGARYDVFDIEVDNVVVNEQRSRKDTEISPRIGFIYKPYVNVSVYGSYSESFMPRSGEQYDNINGDRGKLDPDRYESREIGFKWDLRDALSLTAAVFRLSQLSPQVADSDPATLDIIEAETEGYELQINAQLSDYWRVNAAYSAMDGDQVNRQGPNGKRLRELPESTFAIWNEFQITADWRVGLGATYQDASFIDNANRAYLPSFTRWDATASYRLNENTSLKLRVENLTDKLYFPSAHSTHQASVGAPLHVRFSFTTAF